MFESQDTNNSVIGAIVPSSGHLAQAMIRYVPKKSPKRILEVGAGLGTITDKVLKKMSKKDHLDIVEIEGKFIRVLQEKYGHLSNVTLFRGDILKWKPKCDYDYIISSLPFNSFSAELVEEIMNYYMQHSKPQAVISFFEYRWIPTVLRLVLPQREKSEFQKMRSVVEFYVDTYEFDRENILLNIPPAIVHYLRKEPNSMKGRRNLQPSVSHVETHFE